MASDAPSTDSTATPTADPATGPATSAPFRSPSPKPRVALLHGAGYVGGELIRLLAGHPRLGLAAVTSRTYAGESVAAAHPALRGTTAVDFAAPDALNLADVDAAVVAAEHGSGMAAVAGLRAAGFDGPVVDLSADFRFESADAYETVFGTPHAAPDLLGDAVYGLPERTGRPNADTRLVANPGCFATGLALALGPLVDREASLVAHVTGLTGASGSGAQPSAATHFPDRDGNARAYKVLEHRHVDEIRRVLGPEPTVAFVPVSGPWTRGIWGTAHVEWPDAVGEDAVAGWFEAAYGDAPLVRLSAGTLPELQPVVRTPFCDLGWRVRGRTVVVGFALDNLGKGAATQAIQNLNRMLGLPETAGLLVGTPDG
jgi:N-acetyl-gamma-glutamyl-phosphate reductase